MEKIIFFGLVIPIFAFVLYLGVNAIMKGMSAKNAIKEDENENSPDKNKNLSEQLDKLNQLHQSGVLTKEEFEKAKNKLLNN
tara:strand:- start:6 stop:251 length:246 start_codon:yes stop_codon:yes gene_type:complete